MKGENMHEFDGPTAPLVREPEPVSVRRIEPDKPDDPNPIRASVHALTEAVMKASEKIREQTGAAGNAFELDSVCRSACGLIAKLSQLIELLDKYPPPADPSIRFIPPCPECNAKAGEHWTHDCPKLDRFNRDCIYDYRNKRVIFEEQIRPLAEPLKPNRYDRFTCVACVGVWAGIDADQLIKEGHDLGSPTRKKLFEYFRKEMLG